MDKTGFADARLAHDEQVGAILTCQHFGHRAYLVVEAYDILLGQLGQHVGKETIVGSSCGCR